MQRYGLFEFLSRRKSGHAYSLDENKEIICRIQLKYTQNAQYIMAVTIDGMELLYAEMFSAVIDSNMHDRLALN